MPKKARWILVLFEYTGEREKYKTILCADVPWRWIAVLHMKYCQKFWRVEQGSKYVLSEKI